MTHACGTKAINAFNHLAFSLLQHPALNTLTFARNISQCCAAPERDIVVAGCKLHMFRCNKVIREEAAPVAAMYNPRDCAFMYRYGSLIVLSCVYIRSGDSESHF